MICLPVNGIPRNDTPADGAATGLLCGAFEPFAEEAGVRWRLNTTTSTTITATTKSTMKPASVHSRSVFFSVGGIGSVGDFLVIGRIGGTFRVIIGDCGTPDKLSGTAGLGAGRPECLGRDVPGRMEELAKDPLPAAGGTAGLWED